MNIQLQAPQVTSGTSSSNRNDQSFTNLFPQDAHIYREPTPFPSHYAPATTDSTYISLGDEQNLSRAVASAPFSYGDSTGWWNQSDGSLSQSYHLYANDALMPPIPSFIASDLRNETYPPNALSTAPNNNAFNAIASPIVGTMVTSYPGRRRMHTCRICSRSFARKGDMERHAKCHGPPLFLCPVLECKYHFLGFTRKDKYDLHFRTHQRP